MDDAEGPTLVTAEDGFDAARFAAQLLDELGATTTRFTVASSSSDSGGGRVGTTAAAAEPAPSKRGDRSRGYRAPLATVWEVASAGHAAMAMLEVRYR